MAKLIEIFKPGTHATVDGRSITFSEVDVRLVAQGYDPELHKAPLVVGHPKMDDPAYGWAGKLEFSDGVLKAEPDQVEEQFAELVNAGRFPKISASLYPPDHPRNPKPGQYYLKHIGFLGAMAPAVKGLKCAEFADEEGVLTFGDYEDRLVVGFFRRIKNLLIEKFGNDEAERVINEYDLETLQADAVQDETEEEDMTKVEELEGQVAAFQEQLNQKDATIATLTGELSALKVSGKRSELVAFCESPEMATRISPAMKESVVNRMLELSFAAPVEFGEGDAKVSRAPLEVYQDELKTLPQVVSFGEQATHNRSRSGSEERETAADYGGAVDENRLAQHNAALEYMEQEQAAGRSVSYQGAITFVINHKEG
jgi:hypothetical protein